MDKLYSYLLDALDELNSCSDNSSLDFDSFELTDYLESLKPFVVNLRKGYRTNSVRVDYSDLKVQAAYLLAYYPQYVEMTREVLASLDLEQLPFKHDRIKVCLFGAGPAPEVVGLIDFLNEKFPNVRSIEIQIYDIFSGTWKWSRDITEYHVAPCLWKGELTIASEKLDFCEVNAFNRVESCIQESDFFFFQNCLNELPKIDVLLDNIGSLLKKMPAESQLVIADLAGFQGNVNIQERVKTYVEGLNKPAQSNLLVSRVSPRPSKFSIQAGKATRFRTKLQLPGVLKQHLLTGKFSDPRGSDEALLTPRVNVEYILLSIQKLVAEQELKPKVELTKQADIRKVETVPQPAENASTRNVEELYKELDRVKFQLGSLEQHIAFEELETNVKALDLEVSRSHNQIVQLQNQVEMLNAKVDQQQVKLQAGESKIDTVDTSIQEWIRKQKNTLEKQVQQSRLIAFGAITIGLLGLVLAAIALFK